MVHDAVQGTQQDGGEVAEWKVGKMSFASGCCTAGRERYHLNYSLMVPTCFSSLRLLTEPEDSWDYDGEKKPSLFLEVGEKTAIAG